MVEGDQLVALIGKRRAGLLVVAVDLFRTVEDLAGRNDLVARIVEAYDRADRESKS